MGNDYSSNTSDKSSINSNTSWSSLESLDFPMFPKINKKMNKTTIEKFPSQINICMPIISRHSQISNQSVYQRKRISRRPHLLMLGLDRSGKTSLLTQIQQLGSGTYTPTDSITHLPPTIGYNVEPVTLKNDLSARLWDASGAELTRDLWKHYYCSETDCLIWVVDSSDIFRLRESKEELHKVMNSPVMEFVPLLVVSHKKDLIASRNSDEIREFLNLNELEKNREVKIIETTVLGKKPKAAKKILKSIQDLLKASDSNEDFDY